MYIHIMKREMFKNHILHTAKTLLSTICGVVVDEFISDSWLQVGIVVISSR